MYTDSLFRICLIASVSIHLCLISPWSLPNLLPKREIPLSRKIEMTYLKENKIVPAPAKDIKLQAGRGIPIHPEIKNGDGLLDKPAGQFKAPEPVSVKAEELKSIKDSIVKKEENVRIAAEQTKENRNKVEIIDIGTRKGTVYEKYYFDVRERIRSVIEKNKQDILKESEVCIRFIVDRNGNLKDIYLYKSNGPDADSLERLAVKSIREAAPFPPFTSKINEGELQFNLPIKVIRY